MNKKTKLALVLAPAALLGAAAYELKKALPRKDKPLPGRCRIACIGDSITFGAGVSRKRDTQAWPYVMGRRLGDAYQVLNYGINGATALVESQVVFKRYHDFIDAAILAEPALYLMMLGTNDAKNVNWRADDFYRDYGRMIDRMQEGSPGAKIVLLTPPTAFSSAFGIDPQILHEQTVPLVEKIAGERGLTVVDVHAFTAGHPEWFGDGIHPNAEGNLQMAEFVFENILPVLEPTY